jgi:hypothetical protein
LFNKKIAATTAQPRSTKKTVSIQPKSSIISPLDLNKLELFSLYNKIYILTIDLSIPKKKTRKISKTHTFK